MAASSAKLLKLELNTENVKSELLQGAEISAYVDELATGFAARCGAGYETETYVTDRHCAAVKAVSDEARRDDSQNNTILKVVGV